MIVQSMFGDLASNQNIQALLDNSIDFLNAQSRWRQYMDWGLPRLELTFETIIGRSRIGAAASIVDIDAPAPTRSRGKLEMFKGKIPTMKEAFELNQKDYRALLNLQNLPISDSSKKNELIKQLFDDVSDAVLSTDRRLDIMFYQGVSTFSIDCSVLGNPDGAALGAVPLLAADYQTRLCSTVWTNTAADPFKDIRDVITFCNAKGRKFEKILMDESLWLSVQNLAAVKSAISGYQNPGSNKNFLVTIDTVNNFLVANRLPMIELVNERRNIESDGDENIINPFKAENVVFLPAGKLGVVENALAIEDMKPVPSVSYAKYDRTLLAKWQDNNPWKEVTQVELNAFPSFSAIDGIYILKTDTAAA